MNPSFNIPGSGSALTTSESISGRNLGHSPEADAIGDKERNATASWPTESDVLMVLLVVVVVVVCAMQYAAGVQMNVPEVEVRATNINPSPISKNGFTPK